MNAFPKKIEAFFLTSDVWVYGGLILFGSLYKTNEYPPYSWTEYLSYTMQLTILFCPVLLFESVRGYLVRSFRTRYYIVACVVCFGGYLPVFTWWYPNVEMCCGILLPADFLITIALLVIGLKVVLEANRYLRKKIPSRAWLRFLELDTMILLSMLLIALILALMTVSSMNNPEYHTKEQLLIGYVFDFQKIIYNLWSLVLIWGQFFITYFAFFFFYYINRHFLIPKLLKQRGFITYFLATIACIVLFYPIWAQIIMLLPINSLLGGMVTSAFHGENGWGAFAIIAISLPIVLTLQWFRQNNQIIALEKSKAQTELDLLKQQVNPHFFFNTLNNLYSLSLAKSDQTPELILQLSDLMRYVIYKGKEQKVAIEEDITYIEDYIRLQQIRLHKEFDFRFEKQIQDNKLQIPPLLLITLVENAFKHGIEPAEGKTNLHLHLYSDAQSLLFTSINTFEPGVIQQKGIGLENLKQKLILLFPEKHELLLQSDGTTYTAKLKLLFS
ncbi:sensor histidine kinase [Xanthocytophaga agilis]|uniref:Sensor histidine kinase n=1 Tax=Xanthocytophaga agilis TaxID=3048010 RepID=A0AAE3R2S0_9BACT|nr:sensor histidine kinase [Xanthocytophaga agilis]MDJ1500275.1 sensor histidine kinase [Xanthocytophaga agilis]